MSQILYWVRVNFDEDELGQLWGGHKIKHTCKIWHVSVLIKWSSWIYIVFVIEKLDKSKNKKKIKKGLWLSIRCPLLCVRTTREATLYSLLYISVPSKIPLFTCMGENCSEKKVRSVYILILLVEFYWYTIIIIKLNSHTQKNTYEMIIS